MTDPLEISYALSKQVPDMARGFTIHTNYGDLHISAEDATPYLQMAELQLHNKLVALQKGTRDGN